MWLFVIEQFWSYGVGTMLHDALVTSIPTERWDRFLWAIPDNQRAEQFYARKGWQMRDGTKLVEIKSGSFPLCRWELVGNGAQRLS
jgi:GNAT superfamily N-acetyltransferase